MTYSQPFLYVRYIFVTQGILFDSIDDRTLMMQLTFKTLYSQRRHLRGGWGVVGPPPPRKKKKEKKERKRRKKEKKRKKEEKREKKEGNYE